MRTVVPVIAAILLAAILVPFASGVSSASVTMDYYNVEVTEEVNIHNEPYTNVICIFHTNSGGFVTNGCVCGLYNDRACTDSIVVLSGVHADLLYESLGDDESTCLDVTVFFCIDGTYDTIYVKFTSGSQYWIYEVVIHETEEGTGGSTEGSDTTTSFELSSATVESVSYSDGVYSFNYLWIFTTEVSEYSSWVATLYSDSDCTEELSSYAMSDGDLAFLTYEDVGTCGIDVNATVSTDDFYIVLAVADQTFTSHVVFTTSDGEEVSESSTITVETNEIIEVETTTSLIFDNVDALVKVFLVLGAILLVVFVVFGFGATSRRRF